jgi:hypothetical protein
MNDQAPVETFVILNGSRNVNVKLQFVRHRTKDTGLLDGLKETGALAALSPLTARSSER